MRTIVVGIREILIEVASKDQIVIRVCRSECVPVSCLKIERRERLANDGADISPATPQPRQDGRVHHERCAARRNDWAETATDTTPPVVSVTKPSGDEILGVIGVEVTAFDPTGPVASGLDSISASVSSARLTCLESGWMVAENDVAADRFREARVSPRFGCPAVAVRDAPDDRQTTTVRMFSFETITSASATSARAMTPGM